MEPITRLGRFEILDTLGSGSIATAYRARDTLIEHEMAVKVLHPHLSADASFAQRFQQEARAFARLRHRNIVTIYEVGETDDGRPYLDMELLRGRNLARLIAERAPLSVGEVAPILTQLSSAIDYLHGYGLVHLDLKPSNVSVSDNQVATLMDFPFTRSVDDTASGWQHYLVGMPKYIDYLIGTPQYISPEQIKGERAGPACDVYALALLAFELLAGRPPFTGSSSSLLFDHVSTPPPSLDRFNPEVSPAIVEAINGALAKDPKERPATAGEFAAVFQDSPSTLRPTPGEPAGEPAVGQAAPIARHGILDKLRALFDRRLSCW